MRKYGTDEVDSCHINDDSTLDSLLIKTRHANLDFDELEATLFKRTEPSGEDPLNLPRESNLSRIRFCGNHAYRYHSRMIIAPRLYLHRGPKVPVVDDAPSSWQFSAQRPFCSFRMYDAAYG